MKIYLYTIFSSVIILFQCCSQGNAGKENDPIIDIIHKYTLDDYYTGKFKVYEAKNSIFPLLDSIIENVSMCEKIKNKQIFYTFVVDTLFHVDTTTVFIGVNDYEHADILCHEADALFFYKGYLFIYHGIFLDMFFKNIDKFIERNCIKPIEIPGDEQITDDTLLPFSLWQYTYKNGILRFIDRP